MYRDLLIEYGKNLAFFLGVLAIGLAPLGVSLLTGSWVVGAIFLPLWVAAVKTAIDRWYEVS